MRAPNFSLTARGWELGRSPRWVIYLAKAGQGAGMALLFAGLVAFLFNSWAVAVTPPFLALIALAVIYVAVAMKVTGLVEAGWTFEPLDWLCDFALFAMWATPFAWVHGARWLAALIVLVWLITYPWSSE